VESSARRQQTTPAGFSWLNTTICTLTLTATGNTPNGPVSDALFSVGHQVVTVTYVTPLVIDGYIVTAPAFTDANLMFEDAPTCPLAWLSNDQRTNVALSADSCDAQLYGAPYPPGRSITLQALFSAPPGPPGPVTVSATGIAECDGYGTYSAAGSVGAGSNSATFLWPAGMVTADTACEMTITVTFTVPGSSIPNSVSSSLPVSFRFHAPVARTVFNSIPDNVPGNVPSQPFQAQQTFEFGDYIQLAGTTRHPGLATVLMSTWAPHSQWPSVGDTAGWDHPITLNIYNVDLTGVTPALGTRIGSVTQTFHIPWRPEADTTCPDTGYGPGFAWRAASDNQCYNGYASTITFDLSSIGTLLPDKIIFGIAYNTMSYGAVPIGIDGPYDSLNVGTAHVADAGVPPSVGTDVEPDAVFWNTITAGLYADTGASGAGIFRRDTGWTGYQPAVQFQAY
jgi:hypothetical protein